MSFSILDIIVFSIGGIIVGLYAFFSIKRLVKFKKLYRENKEKGMTDLYAKQEAMKIMYPKKYKKDNKNNLNDEICED